MRVILSHLTNFSKFREERIQMLQSFTQQTGAFLPSPCKLLVFFLPLHPFSPPPQPSPKKDELQGTIAALSEGNERVEGQIAQLTKQREEEAEQKAALQKVLDERTAELTDYNARVKALNTKNRAAKDRQTELQDQIAQVIFQTDAVKQECQQLRGQIVQSPDRIQRDIEQLETAIAAVRTAVQEASLDGVGQSNRGPCPNT